MAHRRGLLAPNDFEKCQLGFFFSGDKEHAILGMLENLADVFAFDESSKNIRWDDVEF